MPTRRDLLRMFPAAAALPASWTTALPLLSATAAEKSAANEAYWKLVKAQFPLASGLIYLNAANVCPASRPVMDRHLEFLRDFHANPSFQNREKYAALADWVRAKLAAMLGATPQEIAITRNTSEGTNIVVKGIDLRQGDEVIITAHNHPSNNDSWKVRASRDGFTVKTVAVPVPATSRQGLLDGIAQAVSTRTRVIAITHVTNTTGVYYPVKEICAMAGPRNIWVHVDGAQSFGALDVNLKDIGCDSYSGSAHKWFMGPLEAGVLYVRQDRAAALWPSIVTAGWSDSLAGARKFEVFGQRDDPRIASLEAAVDFLALLGMEHVEARMRHLAGRALKGLNAIAPVELKTSLDASLAAGVIRFQIRNWKPRAAYDALYARHKMAIADTASGDSAGLRISPHIYNTAEEIDQAVAAVRELAG